MKSHWNMLAIATAVLSLPLAGVAQNSSAQNTQDNSGSQMQSTGMGEAMRMAPADAELSRNLDARKDHPGSPVRAHLTQTVHLKNGPELKSGTILIGQVVADDMQQQGTSRLALRFDQAQLKDGKVIPIKATITSIFLPQSGYYPSTPPPNSWSDQTLRIDQINVVPGVDLHSNIASRNSGVFVSTKKDVKLGAGSDIQLAVAPAAAAGTTRAGS